MIVLLAQQSAQAATEIQYTLPGPYLGPSSPGYDFEHTLSDGTPLPDGYEVQIGIFEGSFVPSAANVSEWADHWRSLSKAKYNAPYGIYTAYSSQEHPANFPAHQRFYVFGHQQIGPNHAEVFLATDPNWLIPKGAPLPVPTTADTVIASTFIVGSIDDGLSMQTAAVKTNAPPPHFFTEWALEYFGNAERNDPLIGGESADPDGDGLSNALEYLAGSHPKRPNANPLRITQQSGDDLGLRYQLSGSARATWKLQYSENLVDWVDAEVQPVVNDTFEEIELNLTPIASEGFWRMHVVAVEP
jgi:hypothetical protein